MNGVEVIPSAKRLIRSLRDMGYDFAQAVADIVDNSIEAGATRIAIEVEFEGDNSWVRIADNGKGMSSSQLQEAMRYGAEREYSDESLGKFGLGLKTASMSQCQRLSVASRSTQGIKNICAYAWDLEHIEKSNRWEILSVAKDQFDRWATEELKRNTGTVVLWERLDRILGYKHPYGENARKRLSQMCRDIEEHLSMVFHRYLEGKVGGRTLEIFLNGNSIKPWDPFCLNQTHTKKLQALSIPVESNGVSGYLQLEPYVLPHQNEFDPPEAFEKASGPGKWNQQQGLYIYRSGRIIQSGGWYGIRAIDEHTKLARVALRFTPALDELFKVNVAKMRVQLPTLAREAIKKATIPVLKLAREVYAKKPPSPKPSPKSAAKKATSQSKYKNTSNRGQNSDGVNEPNAARTTLTFEEWSSLMLNFASKNERPILKSIIDRYKEREASH